jgi:hypothetical protein
MGCCCSSNDLNGHRGFEITEIEPLVTPSTEERTRAQLVTTALPHVELKVEYSHMKQEDSHKEHSDSIGCENSDGEQSGVLDIPDIRAKLALRKQQRALSIIQYKALAVQKKESKQKDRGKQKLLKKHRTLRCCTDNSALSTDHVAAQTHVNYCQEATHKPDQNHMEKAKLTKPRNSSKIRKRKKTERNRQVIAGSQTTAVVQKKKDKAKFREACQAQLTCSLSESPDEDSSGESSDDGN